jgi:hypothetical protein
MPFLDIHIVSQYPSKLSGLHWAGGVVAGVVPQALSTLGKFTAFGRILDRGVAMRAELDSLI